MFNMNNGYVGYSMSVRAQEAYENGEMPISKWTKKVLLEVVEAYRDDMELKFSVKLLSKLTLDTLRTKCLRYSSWHHTSKFCNCTDFYSLDEEWLDSLDDLKIENLIQEQKDRKRREKEWQKRLENETSQACKDFIEYIKQNGYEISNSFHYYKRGRKPTNYDYENGLENFFKVGEQRMFKFACIPYLEVWNGTEWIKENDYCKGELIL